MATTAIFMVFWSGVVIFKDCQDIIQTIELLSFCCAEKSLLGTINFFTLLHMPPVVSDCPLCSRLNLLFENTPHNSLKVALCSEYSCRLLQDCLS